MHTPSENRSSPVNALGIDVSSSAVIIVEPVQAHRSLKPDMLETYNSVHPYNGELDTRSVIQATMTPNRLPETPPVEPPPPPL